MGRDAIALKLRAPAPIAWVDVSRRTVHAAFAVLLAGVAVFALTGEIWVRNATSVGGIVLMALHAVRRPDARLAWLLLTLANLAWAAGDVGGPGWQSLYLASYVFGHAGLVFLLAAEARRRWRGWLALDGMLGALTAAAVLTSIVDVAFVSDGVLVPAITLAGDAMILTIVVLAFALSDWRPGRAWWMLAAAEVFVVGADLANVGRPSPGLGVTAAWAAGFVLLCYAAHHSTAATHTRGAGALAIGMPVIGGAVSLAVLMHEALTNGSALAIWLAGGALATGLVRGLVLLATNARLLRRTRAQAVTDKLTGLPNRRALARDLEAAVADGREHTLVFFDLDGFKGYNDAFGHAAGDALLQRLAFELGGYRLGGDEFCLLLDGAFEDDAPEITRAVEALSERGAGYSITASFGSVVVPRDTAEAADALRLADERMYARKRRRRGDARAVLLALLDTGDERVTRLAVDAGRRVGFDVTALLGDAGLPIVATLSDASSAARGPAGAFAAPAGSARSASPDR
jgi:diguanylate cyclase (GGDEF)-like protein